MARRFIEKSGAAAERRAQKFEKWLVKLPRWHDDFTWTPNEQVNWSVPTTPLSESRVALVSSAGIHLKSQPVFDVESPEGDWSYRVIPAGARQEDFMISDTHYDHSDADHDINCILGIHRLHELAAEGFIGDVAPRHFGFMGFIPDPAQLISTTAPEAADMLVEDEVDLVLLTPG